ncbi:MAG: acetyl-CoA carboxylase carboxyltransferase subunit beta [Candidatus Marinimicrobia bacterium]|jgi:acetyl-CoA carboxylase carboxyl transferase subunit beta|nr:acetyl-CoA carboxylase carboxyltransferase subunit beta [Candidatus Neomarinimicrobiota bacterium]MBT3502401.1 acetyl-CoA carboxylase carboxyltransferase subunit beta [Candidatus Neomarinimicrobiota bacterium]MBT3839332.1 acetyl-CoA carboxylase carboxyltransferase subunit beta [Candidatus Neomarinimicrobiota bacterium]MBT3998670.1 acetyl-CoA carboxylase carboxyltransferase subunit beta [Candidatus Neomarinimicrobiota bacterium]MBT4283238.1 acetyl-CoA carboxylase carboxyltransferase subunit b
MSWFKRKDKKFKDPEKKSIPDGLWDKCPSCSEILYRPELEKNLSVCHHCKHHFRVVPQVYVDLLLDSGSETPLYNNLESQDFLKFKAVKKYTDQLHTAKSKTGEMDAIKVYNGTLNGKTVILAIMNFRFIGGSMGSVVGESVSRAIQKAGELKVPFLLVCASGGARMQEGAISLMQLAKTSTQLAKFAKNGGLFIPILTDPTTGGVTASYGMLGDIILAEPGALIGFAGPRVIKQTIGQDLPKGFQRSEFLLEKGFIDHIVSRSEMKEKISTLISLLV